MAKAFKWPAGLRRVFDAARPPPPVETIPLTRIDLEAALVRASKRALSREQGSFAIISSGDVYVQALMSEHEDGGELMVELEAVSQRFCSEMTDEMRLALSADGWARPTAAAPNHHRTLFPFHPRLTAQIASRALRIYGLRLGDPVEVTIDDV
ncbi:MAG: hypothetical protein ACFB0F_13010 [Neomegalonema sp.]